MAILVINSGSSSLKVSLYDASLKVLWNAHLKNMLSSTPILEIERDGKKTSLQQKTALDFQKGLTLITSQCDLTQVDLVGHRVVHGGDIYNTSVIIDPTVIANLKKLSELAPLHNPPAIESIEAAQKLFPKAIQVAVFDTAFHHTIPPVASTYGIPIDLAKKHQIKRYGFHGIAHAYLWKAYGKPSGKIITLHLGNGCSAAAIQNGRSLDTSMGFTPLEGLLMATRSGDIDPGIIEYLCKVEKLTPAQVTDILNTKSGLLGVSNVSSDMKTLLNTPSAKLAIEIFCYRALKYVGAYLTVLKGADAILFSGGIGENAPTIRQKIIEGLAWLNVHLDHTKNASATNLEPAQNIQISTPSSAIDVRVIGVDENSLIASEALALERN